MKEGETYHQQDRDGIDLREDDDGEEEEHADDDDGDETDDDDNDEAFEPCGGNGIINVKSLMRIASSIDLHESQHSPTEGSAPARRSSLDRRPPSTFQQPGRGNRIFEEVDGVSSGGGGSGGSGGSEGGEELSAGMAFGDDPGAAATMLVARLIAGSGGHQLPQGLVRLMSPYQAGPRPWVPSLALHRHPSRRWVQP